MDDTQCLTEFERHLTRRSPGRSTAKHYLSDLHQFQKVCPKAWSAVTSADIDAFVDAGQARGWKAATLQRRVAALKVFFDFYADLQHEPDRPNPVQVHAHAPRLGQRLPHDVPDEIIERLWLAIDQPRDQVWFTLMLRGGLRVGEVASLNRDAILAPATFDQPARLRVKGKGCKERIIYLTADAYAVLARWLQLVPGTPETPVCLNARGERITINGLQERLRHYCQKAGVHLTCHQLRHTYARQLVEHELPVATLAKLLGHARFASPPPSSTLPGRIRKCALVTSRPCSDGNRRRNCHLARLRPQPQIGRLLARIHRRILRRPGRPRPNVPKTSHFLSWRRTGVWSCPRGCVTPV